MENRNQNKLSLLILPIILIVIIIAISVYLLSSLKSVKLPNLSDMPDINKIVNDYFKQEKNFTYNNGKVKVFDREEKAKTNNVIYIFEDLENKLNEIQKHNHINCIQSSENNIFIADDNGNVTKFKLDLLENESDSLQNYLKQNSKYDYLYKFIGQDFILYLDKDSIKDIECSYIEQSSNQYLGIFTTLFDFSIKMSNEEYNKLKATNDFKINENISNVG